MRPRDGVLHYEKTLDDTGTLTENINIADPISAIHFRFQGTNGTTSNKGNWLSDVITKIEIMDGSNVLFSMPLNRLEALTFLRTGKTPPMFPSEWASGAQREEVMLLFGRHLWDQEFAFDAKRYANPQLKVTTNIAAVRAASATTAFATGTLKASIVYKVMENMASRPSRFLSAKEIKAWTSGTSGEVRVDLLRDRITRMLLVRAYVQGSDIDEVHTNAKLTVDSDKYLMFNRYLKEYDAEMLQQFGRSVLKHDFFESHQDKVRLCHNKEPDCRAFYQSLTTPIILGIDYQWSSEAKFNMFTHDGSGQTTDGKCTMVEEGHALHATWPVLFGTLGDPESWLNPIDFGKWELVLTEAVAATCSVDQEQIVNM